MMFLQMVGAALVAVYLAAWVVMICAAYDDYDKNSNGAGGDSDMLLAFFFLGPALVVIFLPVVIKSILLILKHKAIRLRDHIRRRARG